MIKNILIRRGRYLLPRIEKFIDQYIHEKSHGVVRLCDVDLPRIHQTFSAETIALARVVEVPAIEIYPFSKLALPKLAVFRKCSCYGLTLKDTYWVTSEVFRFEAIHFHEMVHITQWNELGTENFLTLYGLGLVRHGYRKSPLEQMAFELQRKFEARENLVGLEDEIRNHCKQLAKALV